MNLYKCTCPSSLLFPNSSKRRTFLEAEVKRSTLHESYTFARHRQELLLLTLTKMSTVKKSKWKTNCFNDQTRGREETSTWWRRLRQTSFFTKTTHFSSGLSSHFNFNERIMTSTTKSKPPHSTSAHKFASVSCRFLNALPTMYEIFHGVLWPRNRGNIAQSRKWRVMVCNPLEDLYFWPYWYIELLGMSEVFNSI